MRLFIPIVEVTWFSLKCLAGYPGTLSITYFLEFYEYSCYYEPYSCLNDVLDCLDTCLIISNEMHPE